MNYFFVGITKLDKTLFSWSSIGFFLRVETEPGLEPLSDGWLVPDGLLFFSNIFSDLLVVSTLFKPFFEWLRIESSKAEWASTGGGFFDEGLGLFSVNWGFVLMIGGGGGGAPPDLGDGAPVACWLNGGGWGCVVDCVINGGGGGGFDPAVEDLFAVGGGGRGFEFVKLLSGFSGLDFNLNTVFWGLNKFLK